MGNIRMGPPQGMVLFLKKGAGARQFVETGTFRGDTAQWASEHFDEVYTIELSPEYHAAALNRFAANTRVRPLSGNSAEVLAALVAKMSAPALFWLDAHWSGLDTSGRDHECPLLQELAAINASPLDHVVLVDDARLFCAPPPAPHRAADWPDLFTTVSVLAAGGRRHVVLRDDVLAAVPVAMKDALVEFVRSSAANEPSGRGGWRRWLFR